MGEPGAAALLPLLDDADPKVRRRVASQLGEMGPAAGKAVPKLIEMLRTEDRDDHVDSIRKRFGASLVKIGARPCRP